LLKKHGILNKKILTISNLHKHYGRIKAIDGIDLVVHSGEVLGILGPNGSGKTTTLGVVLSVIKPTAGSFKWFEASPSPSSLCKVGAILERPLFYPYLDAVDNLKIIADIRKVSYEAIDEVLVRVELLDRKHSKFRTFSLGMKQRLAIASALLGNPEVLILDEPTNGLDPQGIAEIRTLIQKISQQGTTIILASHLLDEVQKICSHVVVLNKGIKIYEGRVKDLIIDNLTVEVQSNDMPFLEALLTNWEGSSSIEKKETFYLVKLHKGYNTEQLNHYIFSSGHTLNHLASGKNNLEQHFLELLTQPK
jgi:ABC-2 type transport system ATP-binding protein